MLKKCFSILITIILILGMCLNVNAAELKTKLDVIAEASETKYLENDQGYISKTIVDSNEETGEVTIELKLSNTKKEVETNGKTEMFLVIDNSPSMDFVTEDGSIRKNNVIESAKGLVSAIYQQSNNVDIGVIKFSGRYSTIGDATVVGNLSGDEQTVLNGIQKIADSSTASGTNIDAGLQRANNNFSDNCKNKIIVLLTDGVCTSDASGTSAGNDTTTEESLTAQANTKATIQRISNSGVYIISMMTGLDPQDTDYQDELAAVTNIFGTSQNPTGGKFYNITDADISNIVNNNILNDVVEKIQQPINTVKIVDYFPEDITDNFEFSYVGNPSIGTASEAIDEETKTITWDIDTLRGDEVATLKYKLKIKDMKNTELLEKTISTNEKVVLTYTDVNAENYTVELASSPKIKLTEVKEELTATVNYNPTSETTGSVTATIKTNKKVNEVEGWTISEDGMTLTKSYKTNATETVYLVDLDGMTKDVEIKITNIIKEQAKNETENEPDNTLADKELPNTGKNIIMLVSVIAIITAIIVIYKKQSEYKDIK